jgi:hypothetical protein
MGSDGAPFGFAGPIGVRDVGGGRWPTVRSRPRGGWQVLVYGHYGSEVLKIDLKIV